MDLLKRRRKEGKENERKNSLKQKTSSEHLHQPNVNTSENSRKFYFGEKKYGFIRQPYLQHFFGFYLNVLFAVKKLFSTWTIGCV